MRLLETEIDLPETWRQITSRERFHLTLVLVTQFSDAISTSLFMSVDGTDSEANALVRFLSIHLGIFAGPLFGKLGQLFALLALCCLAIRLTRPLFLVVTFINVYAVVKNVEFFWRCVNG